MIPAVQHVRRMRGGAQSHLMRAQGGNFYVVKFQNNPQHTRVLANEYLATKLAARAGLPVPAVEIIVVSPWLIDSTPELRIELAGQSLKCAPGSQLGVRYVVDPLEGQVLDYLPDELLRQVKNLGDFAGMLALDKWTCNVNGRQSVFWKQGRERAYRMAFIDQGYCFNAGEWSFPDSPLRGAYARNLVYAGVTGWESFEPWLTKIEEMSESTMGQIASEVPGAWYGTYGDMEKLLDALGRRRRRVRELITAFRESSRQPFPAWK